MAAASADDGRARTILEALDLGMHVSAFLKEGWDEVEGLMQMTTQEMLQVPGVSDEVAQKLGQAQKVWSYLCGLNFQQYACSFFQNGYDELPIVESMDEVAWRTCGVRPGHIAKLARRKRQRLMSSDTSAPGSPSPVAGSPITAPAGAGLASSAADAGSLWTSTGSRWEDGETWRGWSWDGEDAGEKWYKYGWEEDGGKQPEGGGGEDARPMEVEAENVFERIFADLGMLDNRGVSDILRSAELRSKLCVSEDLRECKAASWSADRYCQKFVDVKDIPLRPDRQPYQHDEKCALNKAALLPVLEACRAGNYQHAVDAPAQRLKIDMIQNTAYEESHIQKLEEELPERFSAFDATEVVIRASDCLSLAVELAKTDKGLVPVVLNMANPDHPGGGFDNGRLAQEEDMFRRTTIVAATPGPFEEFLRPNKQLERVPAVSYPISEFGVILTQNVEILRGEQKDGLPFLEEPVVFHSLACAAYQVSLATRLMKRHNTSQAPTRQTQGTWCATPGAQALNEQGLLELTPTYAMLTFQKLRSLLLVARKHNCKTVILSALGCGAFGSPPEHMAFIFREVISEFAGAFERLYFAITPGRNLDEFKDVFQVDSEGIARFNALARLPRRIFAPEDQFEKLAAAPKKLCAFGGACRNCWTVGYMEGQGCAGLFHPSQCPRGGCTASALAIKSKRERWHTELYTHPVPCPFGAACSRLEEKPENSAHRLVATHEFEKCPQWSKCNNRTLEHERQYLHPPLCEHPVDWCTGDAVHMAEFRHPDTTHTCHETVCPEWNDPRHVRLCHGRRKGKGWIGKALCPYMNCARSLNAQHVLEVLHIHFGQCPLERERGSGKCWMLDPDHLDTYFHTGSQRQMSKICRYGRRCRDMDREHHRHWRHEFGEKERLLCPAYPMRPFWRPVDYQANMRLLAEQLNKYMGAGFNTDSANFSEIAQRVRCFRPVHRCTAKVFASILKSKKLFSLMKLRHSVPPLEVQMVLEKCTEWGFDRNKQGIARRYMKEYLLKSETPSAKEWAWYSWHLGPDKLALMKEIFQDIAAWAEELQENLPGIGYDGDAVCGLDDTVFSIFGPHNTEFYGQIQLVLAPEVMLHPNSYFLPCAGTYFNKGQYQTFNGLAAGSPTVKRQWIDKPKKQGKGVPTEMVRESFMQSMWHCSVDGWWETIARELVARVAQWKVKAFEEITWQDVLEFNRACEGHSWLEAHLPRDLPLSYVTNIVMPSVSSGEMEKLGWDLTSLRKELGGAVTVTVKGSEQEAKEAAEGIATALKPTFPPGILFTTQEPVSDTIFHSPTGLVLSKTTSGIRRFRFKAAADAAFNIVLTSSPVRLAAGMMPEGSTADPQNDRVVVVRFFQQGHLHIVAERGQGQDVLEMYPNFNSWGTSASSNAAGWQPGFVDYLFELEPNELRVEHIGLSSILLARRTVAPQIVFRLPWTFDEGPVYVGCSSEYEGCSVTIADLRPVDEKPNSSSERYHSILEKPERQLPDLLSVDGAPPRLPLCTVAASLNLPIEMCPLQDNEEHTSRFSHPCPWGKSCRFLEEDAQGRGAQWMAHHTRFVHKDLPWCKDGDKCKKRGDPWHRCGYHHAKCKDWIVKCMKSPCPSRQVIEHAANFCHDPSKDDSLKQCCLEQYWL